VKKRGIWTIVGVLVILGLLLSGFGCAAPATEVTTTVTSAPEQKVYEWRMQSHSAPTLTQYKNLEEFCDDIRVMSDGRLDITLYPAAALVPSADIFSSTAKGVIEVGACSCAYHVGFMPENVVSFAPMACRNGDDLHAIWNRGLKDLFTKSYAENGVHLLIIKQSDNIPLLSTKKISRVTDLDGMKVRTISALVKLTEQLGASSVSIPGGEVYQALALGTVDACTWGGPGSLYNWKWYESAHYLMSPPLIPASWGEDIFVNVDKWNELTPDLQAIVQIAAEKNSVKDRYDLLAEDRELLGLMINEGLEVVELPLEDVDALVEASKTVWADLANTNPKAKEAMIIITDYLREQGYTDFKIQ